MFNNPYINIFDLNNKNENTDITLVFDDGVEIKTHKLLLLMYSEYFKCMFANFMEKNQDTIKLSEINSKIFNTILNNLYTLSFNSDDFDIYESIEFYRTLVYLGIKFNKKIMMSKLFGKYKFELNELDDIFEAAYSFTTDEKKLLFELINDKKSSLLTVYEYNFINKHNLDIKDLCSICQGEITREYRYFKCNHIFHNYCLGDAEKQCPFTCCNKF